MTQPACTSPESTDNDATPGHKPVDKFREGPVHVSIWENQGLNGTFRVASFEPRYKKDEQWQTTATGPPISNFWRMPRRRPAIALTAGCVNGARQGHTPAA